MTKEMRTLFLCGVAASVMVIPQPVYAQTQTATAAGVDNSSEAAPDIVVTGSRLKNDAYSAPTPVTVASVEDLAKSAPTNIPDALNQLPQFTSSSSPKNNQQSNANVPNHGNVLNLRGIGGIRTLILMDGVRVPPTTYIGTVDTDVIPQLLVKQVEVVTAGASAAYGSDAVAGVVNFVLDNNLDGVRGVVQHGISSRGDNANFRAGIAGGWKITDQLHALFSIEHFKNGGLLRSDRPDNHHLAVGSTGIGPAGSATNPLIFVENARTNIFTLGGLVVSGPFAGTSFTGPGQFGPVNPGTPTGTAGAFTGGGFGYFPESTQLLAALQTDQAFAKISYDVTENITAYVQAFGSRSKVDYNTTPPLILFSPPTTIFSGNAFLPAALQQKLTNTGTPGFAFNRIFADLGATPTHEQTNFYDVSAGFKGKIGSRFSWNVDFTHGEAVHKVVQENNVELRNMAAAVDAVDAGSFAGGAPNGNIVCRVTLTNPGLYPGCVPFNPFGEGAASAAAADYVLNASSYRARNTQDAVAASIQGDVATLWAGPLSFAAGVEYRRQTLDLTSNADPAVPLPTTGLRGIGSTAARFFLTNVGSAHGKNNVKEAFIEVGLPVLRDLPFVKLLDFNAAGRLTDYSTSGSVKTWKVGGTWTPIDGLRFRIARSRDIRAPTLYDLFAGEQFNRALVNDPLTGLSNGAIIQGGGNANLKPEIGDTFTTGAVFQPRFMPNLSIAIDYFDLKVSGAISTLSANNILQLCFNSNNTSSVCGLITRPFPTSNTTAANFPTAVRAVGVNAARMRTTGVDIDASYRTRLGAGQLGLRLFATYTQRFQVQPTVDSPLVDYAGYSDALPTGSGAGGGIPKFRATASANYEIGGYNVFVQEQMIGRIKFGPTLVYAVKPIEPVFYTSLTVSKTIPVGSGNVEAFGTVNNLFDRKPPLAPMSGAIGQAFYPTLVSIYDVAGRSFTAGLRLKL